MTDRGRLPGEASVALRTGAIRTGFGVARRTGTTPAARRPGVAPSRGPLRRMVDMPLFLMGVVLFWLASLLWSVPAGVLARVLPRRTGAPLGQWAIMAGFRAFIATMEGIGLFRCDLRALDALRDEGALIIAPNHPALLDAVLVISRLPRVVCITKASLWNSWFLGGGIRLAGYIRNDAPLALVRNGLAALQGGQQMLIFPEGTRTVTPPVNAFKGGFAIMAQKSGVPVQTVLIESPSRYLTKGWPLFRRPDAPLLYRARLGRRFIVPPDRDPRDFMAELQDYFRAELAEAPERR
jgi:1-acyl-sn-glycerol-3-phosphate acyltransferase